MLEFRCQAADAIICAYNEMTITGGKRNESNCFQGGIAQWRIGRISAGGCSTHANNNTLCEMTNGLTISREWQIKHFTTGIERMWEVALLRTDWVARCSFIFSILPLDRYSVLNNTFYLQFSSMFVARGNLSRTFDFINFNFCAIVGRYIACIWNRN